jgi:hypothetical protein
MNDPSLLDTWTSVQRAETLLVRTAVQRNPALMSQLFHHRLRGLHPAYDPPQLWHHWQRVWAMLAAREDEREYVRQQRNLPPLVWFIRRQIWFVHRRPWLVRGKPTLENLARAIHAALDLDITVFDTAANYGVGHSSKKRGQFCRGAEPPP